MRYAAILPLAAALSLVACNKPGNGSDAGGSTAAGNGGSLPEKVVAAATEMRLQPGLYQATVDVKAFDVPGMPPQVAAAVKSNMAGKPMTFCLSAEDAAKGVEAMKEHIGKGGKCQFNKFQASGGTIDQDMTCQMGQGTMHVVGHGTYTDTGSVVASTADMSAPGGKGMHVEQVTTTKRVGDCTK
ncbi:MAG: DUF3617 domain-containing protein [Novosphingobium sp.]